MCFLHFLYRLPLHPYCGTGESLSTYSDDFGIFALFVHTYIRETIITHYSLIWIIVDVTWLLLEQFGVKEPKNTFDKLAKSPVACFIVSAVSVNNLPPVVM